MTALNAVTWGEGEPVIFVHGSMGWGTDTFPKQRPLSDQFKLILVDRRGFGDSPPTERSDFEVDAHDIAELLDDGAHLVGHSYGAVVCLLTAGLRPEAVRSLAVIEPPAYSLMRGNEMVEQTIEQMRLVYTQTSPEEFYFTFIGIPPGEPRPEINLTPKDIAAIRTTMTQRPLWEAEIPLDKLAAARFPKMVVSGGRMHLPAEKRTSSHLKAICDLLAERIGAERVVFENAAHNPQLEVPQEFNARLRAFWASASAKAP